MSGLLAEKLKNILGKQGVTVAGLERAAGLKTGAVRNIIVGRSKKPSAETLSKIAHALSCSIDELTSEKSRLSISSSSVTEWDSLLHKKCIDVILETSEKLSLSLNFSQASFLIDELYFYSLKNSDQREPDRCFSAWLVEAFKNKKAHLR